MGDFIDEFGKVIDKLLEESDVRMMVRLPKGTIYAEVRSPFTDTLGPAIDFYILLHGLEAVVTDMMNMGVIDPGKEEDMIDSILELVKMDILQRSQNGD